MIEKEKAKACFHWYSAVSLEAMCGPLGLGVSSLKSFQEIHQVKSVPMIILRFFFFLPFPLC